LQRRPLKIAREIDRQGARLISECPRVSETRAGTVLRKTVTTNSREWVGACTRPNYKGSDRPTSMLLDNGWGLRPPCRGLSWRLWFPAGYTRTMHRN